MIPVERVKFVTFTYCRIQLFDPPMERGKWSTWSFESITIWNQIVCYLCNSISIFFCKSPIAELKVPCQVNGHISVHLVHFIFFVIFIWEHPARESLKPGPFLVKKSSLESLFTFSRWMLTGGVGGVKTHSSFWLSSVGPSLVGIFCVWLACVIKWHSTEVAPNYLEFLIIRS